MSTIYEFRDVKYSAPKREKGVDGVVQIIGDATFDLAGGALVAIVGPSGAGKSTLLRLFNRLADPTFGTILFKGKDIRSYPVIELRRSIGWVPQVPVRFAGTVEDNLRLPFTLSKEHIYTKGQITKAIGSLKELDLIPASLYTREADDLSVGEAQRLNLLRALALEPEVLLLDEPTSALDPDSAEALLSQIEKIKRERNLTAIMVSHRPDEVKRIGAEILKIRDGEVRPLEAAGEVSPNG